MRITAQILNDAPIVLNPESNLTLQLRNLQIPYLENLGITQDKYNTIDLTNNDLTEFDNIPRLKNLETLLLGNNHISQLEEKEGDIFKENLPHLRSLSLMNNRLSSFSSIKSVRSSQVEHLILIGNPIASSKHYRSFVIWLIPSLKVLDCTKVRKSEREEASRLYGIDFAKQTPLAQKLLNDENSGDYPIDDSNTNTPADSLTEKEREKLVEQLKAATSIEEIEKIEHILKNGHM